MNAPQDELLKRKAQAAKFAERITGLQESEPKVKKSLFAEFESIIHRIYPHLKGHCLEADANKITVKVAIVFDLTQNQEQVNISANIIPPVCEIKGGRRVEPNTQGVTRDQ